MEPRLLLQWLLDRDNDNSNSLAAKLKNATTQPQIHKFLTGKAKQPRHLTLEPVARHYGIPVDAFYNEEAADQAMAKLVSKPTTPPYVGGKYPVAINLDGNPDYPSVRRVKIKAQAGISGYAVEYMNDDGQPIVFRADWYKAKGYRPERMLALRVCGDSMIPNLYDGDLIVVNTEQAAPKQGLPFLVSYEGEVCVKRLVRDDGLWWLTSDNPDQRRYPRTKCNGGTQIIGEVVYRQTERV